MLLFFSDSFQPTTEKVHQIIARTALFVGEHGGQSEIVLRVKQGDNPTFGFLMPHHHLHPYFRYLVDHLELLRADHDGKSQKEKTNEDQTGGALSLLGSFYGTGEDEDGATVVDHKSKQVESDKTSAVDVMSKSHQVEQISGPGIMAGKDEIVSKVARPSEVKTPALSKNRVSSIKSVNASAMKKDADKLASIGPIMDKSKASSLFPVQTFLVDPPSEVKRLVDRIVEIILKNGKDFEAVLIEQDKKLGRFPFLLPSNQYHPYYLKVLKNAQESRLRGKSFSTERDGLLTQEMDDNTAHRKERDISSLGSGAYDLTLDYDKKEKFKMVIGKSKKDASDHPSKETQQHSGITVDTAAAVAILQAATRGIKKPNLDIISKTSLSGASHCSSNEGGQASSFGSLQSSQHHSSAQKQIENGKSSVTIPAAKEIANTAARAAAGEADSSEAGMTREQKLKAERLRRAKMFAAMIKSGVAPLGTETQHASSEGPSRSGVPGSGTEIADVDVKDREGSSVPAETETSIRIETVVRNSSEDDFERKAKKRRHYRSRKHDESEGQQDEYERKSEKDDEEEDDPRHSRKKHRSRQSSRHHRDRSKDRHKHQRKHSLSRSKESRHRHKQESTSSLEEDDVHNRYMHDSSSDAEPKRHKRRHKHDISSEDERKHRKRKHKHLRKEEGRHKGRSRKGERTYEREEIELEEGEIRTKSSDQSSSAICDETSTEASVDASKSSYQEKAPSLPPPETTEVPDELRAKIRAMLLATM